MNTTRENLIHALDMILQAAQKQLDAMHKDDMLDMMTNGGERVRVENLHAVLAWYRGR